ncbi:hypothetical protein KUTeg_019229 [Tegillarca granosa]|uniref:phosphoethanolamine N-methyltransferase n=1 Tax=Tegillarca granosa TaxID=220873 RepID=A0ABQ9EHW1_TEGGR|nr:hypothetical protein KUTeg_019229 [Tegillarca granosa]
MQTAVRSAMTEFWEEHSQDGSLNEMMLDDNAEELCRKELPEILSYLPPYENQDVIELGAGIGRFTGEFAKKVKSILAVDFMENFIAKNKELNKKYTNIEYKQADVTKLTLPAESSDVVFSNWLLMYLDDVEVQNLMKKMLLWLREDGYVFIRESCFHQSGDKARSVNPTNYRSPDVYDAMFNACSIPTEDGQALYGFDIVLRRSVHSYTKLKQNSNQYVWLVQKVKRALDSNHGFKSFQDFLDNQQYSKNGILRYEKIFGRTYVSTGGYDTTKEFVSMLNLKHGQEVLDVGCGIGGSAFYMVKEFGVTVTAIDLSINMVDIGIERAEEVNIKDEVQFEVADATKRDYPPNSFDVVYSRDTILHIADKLSLFKKFFKWLRPGGKVLISDYCCSEGEHSDRFKAYVKQRGYNLLSPQQYGKVLEEAGFTNVKAEDRTDLFVKSLEKELERAETIKDEFLQEFSQEDYDYIVNGWKDKIVRTGEGDQRWGCFYAEKPRN